MNETKDGKSLLKTSKRAWTSPKLMNFGDVRSVTKQTKVADVIEDNDPTVLKEFLS